MTALPEVTVELYVRALAPRAGYEQVDRVRSELARLADEGAVAEYGITIWGDALPVEGDHPLVDRVAAFRSWADDADVTLVSVERARTGSLVDDPQTVWTLPTLALAEYHDGTLVAVTPHERDGAIHTVGDRLATLAEPADESPDPAVVAPH